MSTRATYEIREQLHGNGKLESNTFYIHYDGYPEGAAVYLFEMLKNKSRGGFRGRFIRANDLAEFTVDHDIHGDTEWRYTVTAERDNILGNGECWPFLLAQCRDFDSDKWKTHFNGLLSDFLNEFAKSGNANCEIEPVSNSGIVLSNLVADYEREMQEFGRQCLSGATGDAFCSWRFKYLDAEADSIRKSFPDSRWAHGYIYIPKINREYFETLSSFAYSDEFSKRLSEKTTNPGPLA